MTGQKTGQLLGPWLLSYEVGGSSLSKFLDQDWDHSPCTQSTHGPSHRPLTRLLINCHSLQRRFIMSQNDGVD